MATEAMIVRPFSPRPLAWKFSPRRLNHYHHSGAIKSGGHSLPAAVPLQAKRQRGHGLAAIFAGLILPVSDGFFWQKRRLAQAFSVKCFAILADQAIWSARGRDCSAFGSKDTNRRGCSVAPCVVHEVSLALARKLRFSGLREPKPSAPYRHRQSSQESPHEHDTESSERKQRSAGSTS